MKLRSGGLPMRCVISSRNKPLHCYHGGYISNDFMVIITPLKPKRTTSRLIPNRHAAENAGKPRGRLQLLPFTCGSERKHVA